MVWSIPGLWAHCFLTNTPDVYTLLEVTLHIVILFACEIAYQLLQSHFPLSSLPLDVTLGLGF